MLSIAIVIFLSVGAFAILALAWRPRERRLAEQQREPDDQFLWRPESISASIQENDFYGQFLNLDQELRPEEGGWTNMKISIPQNWNTQSVVMVGGTVVLTLAGGVEYLLSRENVGDLSFKTMDGGPGKSDEIIEQIWNRHARDQNA
ncbi:hypothetical protein GCM10011487_15660 [Steroidobacter agaridevorans]|uniref:Uncharacterized protein n=1 Tax=Steroidobacter agaridevorans TaxID=2695856 RepID=A0A829YA16_9GAMM|nr:hypothetical protein [Steroidobacter agaridevorans]GFE79566.1 hypothetical protein GCM10011487_15660 [Steroidobacter agaridevorans]GFE88571.1 hypothetical protein GCM10011488_35250 [Steroidobacter agaridevorans]